MDKCDKKIVHCPNPDCKVTMPRQDTEEHVRSTCAHTCKYKSIGCHVRKKRQDMPDHEQDDKLHLHMALDTTLQLKKDNADLRKDLQSAVRDNADMRRDLQSTMRILQLTLAGEPIYKLIDYQKKKEDGGSFRFPAFYTHPRGYHMALSVYAYGVGDGAGTHVSVYAYIVAGEYDAELKWPFLDCVTFTLLNQLEDKNHHSMTMTLVRECTTPIL